MESYQQYITIAGMGKTGIAVNTFLSFASVTALCCDDELDYPDCQVARISNPGFLFKSPGINPDNYIKLSGDIQVINDVELLLRLTLKPVILVTGTNGKSTLVSLLEAILRKSNIYAIACGNNGIPVLEAYMNRPDTYIIELSSYQLENISSHVSEAAVVLNIDIDHIDRYIDINHYQSVKESIYKYSKNPVQPVSENNNLNYSADAIGYKSRNFIYKIKNQFIYKNQIKFCRFTDITLAGNHNYLNVCAALAVLHNLKINKNIVISVLSHFMGLEHRMELVCKDKKGRKWINDSKSTNIHSIKAALSLMSKQVTLIMGGRSKGENYSDLFKLYADKINILILYGEDADLIANQATIVREMYVLSTVSEAIELANMHDNTVLFSPACASFDQYADFNDRGSDFKYHVKRIVAC